MVIFIFQLQTEELKCYQHAVGRQVRPQQVSDVIYTVVRDGRDVAHSSNLPTLQIERGSVKVRH